MLGLKRRKKLDLGVCCCDYVNHQERTVREHTEYMRSLPSVIDCIRRDLELSPRFKVRVQNVFAAISAVFVNEKPARPYYESLWSDSLRAVLGEKR